jgi:hypothetical protein
MFRQVSLLPLHAGGPAHAPADGANLFEMLIRLLAVKGRFGEGLSARGKSR